MTSSAATTIWVRRWSAVPGASAARSVIAVSSHRGETVARWASHSLAMFAWTLLAVNTALLSLPYQLSRLNIQSTQQQVLEQALRDSRAKGGIMAATYDAIVVGGGH